MGVASKPEAVLAAMVNVLAPVARGENASSPHVLACGILGGRGQHARSLVARASRQGVAPARPLIAKARVST